MVEKAKSLPGVSAKFYDLRAKVFKGTRLGECHEFYADGYATTKAGKILNAHPELIAGHWLSKYVYYDEKEGSKATRVTTDGYEVIARMTPGVYKNEFEFDSGTYFMSPDEAASLQATETIHCGWVKDAGRTIDIVRRIRYSERIIHHYYDMQRDFDKNEPAYMSSFAFELNDIFWSLSSILPLSRMDALGLGSGTGTDTFIGSKFFRTYTGTENYPPIFKWSLMNRDHLLHKGLINNNVYFMLKSFTDPDFDPSPYDFVYTYKPIFANHHLMVANLLKLKPGAFFLANLMPELEDQPDFKENFVRKDMPLRLDRDSTSILYQRV